MSHTRRVKRLLISIFLIVIGLAGIGSGLYFLVKTSQTVCFSEVSPPLMSKTASVSASLGQIHVDIGGAVAEPGFYALPTSARLAEAIELAGGLTSQADPEFVAKQLNLSQKLTDEAKIYITTQVETDFKQTKAEFCADLGADDNESGLISINFATQKELETIPGVGEKRAGDIIAGRPYQQLDDLVKKGILTEKIFADAKNLIQL